MRKLLIGIGVAILLAVLAASAMALDPRVVIPPTSLDRNGDRIADRLEEQVATGTFLRQDATPNTDLIVALDHAPDAADRARVAQLGGVVLEEWSDLVFAMHVGLPPAMLPKLARLPGVVFVDENAVARKTLYYSTRQTRARSVWAAGYEGNPNQTVAVLDTGVDDSHPDLAGKVVAWIDFAGVSTGVSGDEYATPTDKVEHGTHVAGTIAGTGAAAGISSGVGNVPITDSLYFNTSANTGRLSFFPVETTGASGNSAITAILKWGFTGAMFLTNCCQIRNDAASTVMSSCGAINGPQPLTVTYGGVPPGTMSFKWSSLPYTSLGSNNTPYWLQNSVPMTAVGDGRNLLRGMAPGVKIAGVKVLDDSGSGNNTTILNGLTWVQSNRMTYNIVAANMSLGYGQVVPVVDTAVNNLVSQGVVCVCAAGNGRGSTSVSSPATASKCIAVAAISDVDRITSFSSAGAAGSSRPDVAAPGGSLVTGRLIVAPDSNDADNNENPVTGAETAFPDAYPNDYRALAGTSMATPHVTGLVALLANAQGSWDFSEANALRIKMLISMTATETNQSAEAAPDPTLQRGGKDLSEGFGRINAEAAVQALTQSYGVSLPATATLGAGAFDAKAWVSKARLTAGVPYSYSLSVPAGADYDLYLYQDAFTTTSTTSNASSGDPITVAQSTTAAPGGTEQISYTPAVGGNYFVVVKWVSGSGAFTLTTPGVGRFSSPNGFVQAGWNLVSIPATPLNGDPLVVLAGVDVPNESLLFWQNSVNDGGYQLYGSAFGWTGPMAVGGAYWFLDPGPAKTLAFWGTANTTDQRIVIPAHAAAPYWISFGHPLEHATPSDSVLFSNTSHPAPLSWLSAYNAGIVESMALGYSSTSRGFFTVGSSSLFADRAKLEPWNGYWLLVNQPDALTITVPVAPVAP